MLTPFERLSSGAQYRSTFEGHSDGVDGSYGSSASGFDDGSDVGVERGSPFTSEPVGDLSVDGAGSQSAFGTVVGRLDFSIGDEHEEMTADLLDDFLELVAGLVGRGQAHQFVEPSIQVGLIGFQRGVGEFGAASSDGAGALEQAFQAGREHLVAFVDGVLDVADEMGLIQMSA